MRKLELNHHPQQLIEPLECFLMKIFRSHLLQFQLHRRSLFCFDNGKLIEIAVHLFCNY